MVVDVSSRLGYDSGSCSHFAYLRYSDILGTEKMIDLDGPRSIVSK